MNVLDKRVCFMCQDGTWATYLKTKIFNLIPIDPDVNISSGASGQVNPLTVLGFLDMRLKNKWRGISHTVGVSQVGLMLTRMCKKLNIPLLNLVRIP